MLTLLGTYAAIAAGYWIIRYLNTEDAKAKKKATDNLLQSYLECLKWPVDLAHGIRGFTSDDAE